MAKSRLRSVLEKYGILPLVVVTQPRPVFFTREQEEKMSKTLGSYQCKGGWYGTVETRRH